MATILRFKSGLKMIEHWFFWASRMKKNLISGEIRSNQMDGYVRALSKRISIMK